MTPATLTEKPSLAQYRREKQFLLQQMLDQPEQQWLDEGRRVVMLHESIEAELARAEAAD